MSETVSTLGINESPGKIHFFLPYGIWATTLPTASVTNKSLVCFSQNKINIHFLICHICLTSFPLLVRSQSTPGTITEILDMVSLYNHTCKAISKFVSRPHLRKQVSVCGHTVPLGSTDSNHRAVYTICVYRETHREPREFCLNTWTWLNWTPFVRKLGTEGWRIADFFTTQEEELLMICLLLYPYIFIPNFMLSNVFFHKGT